MTPIINYSINKRPMPWELIHFHLLQPSDSVMKSMCRHKTLTGLTKKCPKKLNQAPCKIEWFQTILYT